MSKNINMTIEILEVICATLDFKKFIISDSMIHKAKKFDWYEQTKGYYNSLPLPEGMDRNSIDFERVLTYGASSNEKLLNEMNMTPNNGLDKYIWKTI